MDPSPRPKKHFGTKENLFRSFNFLDSAVCVVRRPPPPTRSSPPFQILSSTAQQARGRTECPTMRKGTGWAVETDVRCTCLFLATFVRPFVGGPCRAGRKNIRRHVDELLYQGSIRIYGLGFWFGGGVYLVSFGRREEGRLRKHRGCEARA